MIAMIFEFKMDTEDHATVQEYVNTSQRLKALVASVDGFRGVERFESCSEPGKFVAVGYFEDETAVAEWRNTDDHRRAQGLARAGMFEDYRLIMANVVRDYGPSSRAGAPTDSNRHFSEVVARV